MFLEGVITIRIRCNWGCNVRYLYKIHIRGIQDGVHKRGLSRGT